MVTPQPRAHLAAFEPARHGGPDYALLAQRGLSPNAVIDFSANTNPYGPPPRVRAALASLTLDRYPDRHAHDLAAGIAERHGVPVEQVLVGNGSVELIRLLAQAYLEPGDACLLVEPTFGEYRAAAALAGAEIISYRTKARAGFRPQMEALTALARECAPRLTFLCNPNNPTGVYLPQKAVAALAEACAGGLLVVDAAYEPFVREAWPAEALLRRGNVALLHSMTKAEGLAGLRLGYLLGPEPVVSALRRVQPPWSVNAAAQAAGLAALADAGYLREALGAIAREKERLVGELRALGLDVLPSATNYFLVRVGNAAAWQERLLAESILVRDCASFGLPEYIRIAARRPEENDCLLAACRAHIGAHHSAAGRASVHTTNRRAESLAPVLMVQGTASSVGKSLLVAGLCRLFRREGLRVAPFKAQNMSLNSFVTPEGHEIGRAQVVQAEAAGILPHVDMNPILLKPEADARSQIVLNGRPWRSLPAGAYYLHRDELWPQVTGALDRLRARYDLVIAEGAGSPAEINLRRGDIVNMEVALHAQAAVLLVGDIDRGGVFAALLGTLMLLAPEERALVRGLLINKFRGERALLTDGLRMLEERAGVPVAGVVPYLHNLAIAEEDGVYLEDLREAARAAIGAPRQAAESSLEVPATAIDIVAIHLPHISNFDDLDALRLERGVRVRWVEAVEALGWPAAIIIPGSKNTLDDLAWLRAQGLAGAIVERARAGTALVGICGGYQMLGRTLADPQGFDGNAGAVTEGLGLLPVDTVYYPEKATYQARARVCASEGWLREAAGAEVTGYEIHMGDTRGGRPLFTLTHRGAECLEQPEGAIDASGRIFGTYLHGLFDTPTFRRAWLRSLGWGGACAPEQPGDERLKASLQGFAQFDSVDSEASPSQADPRSDAFRRSSPGFDLREVREAAYDRLSDALRESLDLGLLFRLVDRGR